MTDKKADLLGDVTSDSNPNLLVQEIVIRASALGENVLGAFDQIQIDPVIGRPRLISVFPFPTYGSSRASPTRLIKDARIIAYINIRALGWWLGIKPMARLGYYRPILISQNIIAGLYPTEAHPEKMLERIGALW